MKMLRLGHTLSALRPSRHNGPGRRVALWVQGCVHRCTDRCLSPHLLDPRAGREYPVSEVVSAIERVAASWGDVEGVTVLGGEPFEQAAALAGLLAPLRAAGLSAMVYSGHVWERLRRDPDPGIAALLAQTDVLVDGPFLPDRYDDRLAWRGSSNQRLLCLTDRYTPESLAEAFAHQGKGYSIQVGGGKMAIAGLQDAEATRSTLAVLEAPSLPES